MLKNVSWTNYRGPVALVLSLPNGVSLLGAVINGVTVRAHETSDGRWYVEVVPAGQVFGAGPAISMTLEFSAMPRHYDARVMVGL